MMKIKDKPDLLTGLLVLIVLAIISIIAGSYLYHWMRDCLEFKDISNRLKIVISIVFTVLLYVTGDILMKIYKDR